MIESDVLLSLEFDKILQTMALSANSDATRDAISGLAPLTDRAEIEIRFGQVEEIRHLERIGVPLRLSPFTDITPLLEAVRPEGAVVDPRDLVIIVPALRVMAAVARQMAYRTDIPLLRGVAGAVTGFPDLLEPLEVTLDEEGNILDTASKLLQELRVRKRALTARIRKRLEEIVREKATAIFLQDDFVTQRAGRWVIPVRMDSKGMVAGVVHDISNSGETAFMEPLEIIGLANELENLTADERAEQIRIVRALCAWIREDADAIEQQFAAIVHLDLLNSIARLAELLQAEVPAISGEGEIALTGARHPLLMLLGRERGREIVPLDLALGGDRVMVITGPNAGGKTIALKTTGLLVVMALTGIPVPAASTSRIPLIHQLLVDIGDDQSIEASLSTFSAHVSNIAGILGRADSRTLVLMDELGTGTEPGQGAAIACAVLHDLHEHGALVIATTHLTDIIGFVHKTSGMVNAAMEFDQRTLTPLYRLKTGEPGQSHAIEVARRYGLPERVILFARSMVSRLEADFHLLLAELKAERLKYEEAGAEVERRLMAVADRERLAAERLAAAEQHQRDLLEKSLLEAKGVIQGAKREVAAILDEARREKSRLAREKVRAAEEQVEERLRQLQPETHLPVEKIAPGDSVFVRTIGYDGTVVSVDRKQGRLRVRAGLMELDVRVQDVGPRTGKKPAVPKAARQEADEGAAREINLLGTRVDDALPEVERFLNRASLEGLSEVRIIHGRGTGALMRAVREYLERHPLVQAIRAGASFEGGDGVTVVTLR